MKWYHKRIDEFIKGNIEEWIAGLIWGVIMVFYAVFFSGDTWSFEYIEPIKFTLVNFGIASAITYLTLGRFLFSLYFWRILYLIFGKWFGNYKKFKKMKGPIWEGLKIITSCLIVYLANLLLCLLYNIFTFIAFLFPYLTITLVVIVGYFLYQKFKLVK